jgi:hypothetical protein
MTHRDKLTHPGKPSKAEVTIFTTPYAKSSFKKLRIYITALNF